MTMPSPASSHSAPMFPAGPGFQPTVPMIGPAFGVGAGVPPHPTTFSGDAYGVSDRPKKVSSVFALYIYICICIHNYCCQVFFNNINLLNFRHQYLIGLGRR